MELRKFNIIYGENGRGKSTLSTILRSLSTGEPIYILERTTVDSTTKQEVHFLLDDSTTVDFKDGKWNKQLSDLEIFDHNFVSNNIYSGNSVEVEHRRNLHQFVIGSDGVKYIKAVNCCERALKSIKNRISSKEEEVKRVIIGKKIDIPVFMNLEDSHASASDIDHKITAKNEEMAALRQSKEIISKQSLVYLFLPQIPRDRLEVLLAKSLEGISGDAEMIIRDHIRVRLNDEGENWIQIGFNYLEEDLCPFCGNNISESKLIKAYQVYFDIAYVSLKEEIHNFSMEIKDILSENNLLDLQRLITSNDLLAEFWKKYISFEYPSLDFANIQDIWIKIRLILGKYLERKESNPIECIELKSDLLIALRLYKFITESINKYNQSIKEINSKIDGKKESIKEGDLDQLELDLEILENKKIRLKPEINKLCNNYAKLIKGKTRLTEFKSKAKDSLDSHASAVFNDYESSINKYLELCGAGFRIEKPKTVYSGGPPSVIYSLSIRNKTVELSPRGSKCIPSFKNTLSEGDKSTLAFIFFLAKLDRDSEIFKKIVVFDDPVSSLDDNRRTFTQEQILRLSTRCKQVIIFTHDRYLARQIFDTGQIDMSTLQVKRHGDSSSILEKWDTEADTLSDYFKNYDIISKYIRDGSKDVDHKYQVIRCLRPLLEGYLRVHFPDEFKPNEWLGEFLKKIRAAKIGNPLYNMNSKYEEIDAINNYSKKYHHNQDSGTDSGPINESELKVYAKRTVNLIKGI